MFTDEMLDNSSITLKRPKGMPMKPIPCSFGDPASKIRYLPDVQRPCSPVKFKQCNHLPASVIWLKRRDASLGFTTDTRLCYEIVTDKTIF
jgi:hypothetical protein